jgi:hypothetical protein
MSDSTPTHHKLMRALWNRPRIESAYFVAMREARDLWLELRQLELTIKETRELLDLSGGVPWPPLPAPVRPPTLHEAIRIVLKARDNSWLRTTDIAIEIRGRGLYRRRSELSPTSRDISARVRTYQAMFERDGYFVRLRMHRQGAIAQASETMPSRSSFQ